MVGVKTVRVAFVCFFSALGSFMFGLDMGYIGPIIEDKAFIRDVTGSSTLASHTAGFIVSVFSLGCIFFAFPLVSSYFLDVLGRKVSLMIGSIIFIVGSVIQSLAKDVPVMSVGRFVSGCSIGILSTVVPLYQSELAPTHLRGALTALSQVMICFGILVASLADELLLPLSDGWRWAVLLPVVPGVVLLVGMIFLPRSPRWLVQQGRPDDALKVLAALREDGEAQAELEEIMANHEASKAMGEPRWADLLDGRIFRLLAIGVSLQFLQQVTGINVAVSYGPRIFASLGYDSATCQTMLGVCIFLGTVPSMFLIERYGRRMLLLAGAFGMLVPALLMGILGEVYTRQDGDGLVVLNKAAGVTIALCLYALVLAFAPTWGPTTWVYCAEIFPLRVRGRCVGLTTMSEWVGVYVVNQFTPMLLSAIGFSTFFVVAAWSAVAMALSWWLPETKGVLLERIEKIFDAKFGLARDVKDAEAPGKFDDADACSNEESTTCDVLSQN